MAGNTHPGLRCAPPASLASPDIRRLAATLSEGAVYAGNDSGPRHLAVAVGTPTVTIFGPEDPLEWHPYPLERHPILFVKGLACRRDAAPGAPPWCGIRVCVLEGHRCMTGITPAEVLAKCQEVART
jgi:heptosyltransferase-2